LQMSREVFHEMPVMPRPLLPLAPMVPAQCEPWESVSAGRKVGQRLDWFG